MYWTVSLPAVLFLSPERKKNEEPALLSLRDGSARFALFVFFLPTCLPACLLLACLPSNLGSNFLCLRTQMINDEPRRSYLLERQYPHLFVALLYLKST